MACLDEGRGEEVEESIVELIKNKLILCYIYSTLLYSTLLPLPPSQSKQTISQQPNNDQLIDVIHLIWAYNLEESSRWIFICR